jgi:hypothetical protein
MAVDAATTVPARRETVCVKNKWDKTRWLVIIKERSQRTPHLTVFSAIVLAIWPAVGVTAVDRQQTNYQKTPKICYVTTMPSNIYYLLRFPGRTCRNPRAIPADPPIKPYVCKYGNFLVAGFSAMNLMCREQRR